MALFAKGRPRRRERVTATRAQLGDAAVPEAHDGVALPAAMAGMEQRDETPDIVLYAPREARSWRPLQAAHGRMDGAPFEGDEMDGAPYLEHGHTGRPDPRRVYDSLNPAGYWGTPAETLRPGGPERLANTRGPVTAPGANGAPDRMRAGSTTADPARPAEMPRWDYSARFDQWAQYGPSGLDKIPEAAPTAAEPISQDRPVYGAYPHPGGTGAPFGQMEGVGGQRNTVRYLPRQWDSELVNTGPAAPDAYRRERGWRL